MFQEAKPVCTPFHAGSSSVETGDPPGLREADRREEALRRRARPDDHQEERQGYPVPDQQDPLEDEAARTLGEPLQERDLAMCPLRRALREDPRVRAPGESLSLRQRPDPL